MCCWESGPNLVASIASFICVKSKVSQVWKDSLRIQVRGSHSFIAKDLRESRSGQKGRDTEIAGDDGAILISVCVSAEISILNLTL